MASLFFCGSVAARHGERFACCSKHALAEGLCRISPRGEGSSGRKDLAARSSQARLRWQESKATAAWNSIQGYPEMSQDWLAANFLARRRRSIIPSIPEETTRIVPGSGTPARAAPLPLNLATISRS